MTESEVTNRLQKYAREWDVVVERTIETDSSLIAFGTQNLIALGERSSPARPVVLKIIKHAGDEWRSGEVLQAFDGHGVVRVYEHAPGTVLMEQLRPGTSLVELVLKKDEEATDILADVIQQMIKQEALICPTPGTQQPESPVRETPHPPNTGNQTWTTFVTVHDWARGFDRYIASGDGQIPRELVETAQQTYLNLAATQRHPRLLHGDLQHYNVLLDSDRGWVAIDPKGVFGEVEYEIGAVLRNPIERPDLFLSRKTIERRLNQFTNRLNLDYQRALEWTFAQAVLSAIWTIEDDHTLDPTNPSLLLADAIRPLID